MSRKVLEAIWIVLIPRFMTWKVLVLGVGQYWNRCGMFWYRDIQSGKFWYKELECKGTVSRDLESIKTDLERIETGSGGTGNTLVAYPFSAIYILKPLLPLINLLLCELDD